MTLEHVTTYSDLPDGEKGKHKQIDNEGGFVLNEAIENREVAHRFALLENEAFGDLQESIEKSGLSVDEIIEKLGNKDLEYKEKDALQEMLFQNADLARLKGSPIDKDIEEILKKSYTTLHYSELLTDKVVDGIKEGEVSVIGEALKDQKIQSGWELVHKLKDDEQRGKAFAICKTRVKSACTIIDNVTDTDVAAKMFAEALALADSKSYSDTSDLQSSGRRLAEKLFGAGKAEQLGGLVKEGTLTLYHCEKLIHRFGNDQKTIMGFIENSADSKAVRYAMKFITDKQILSELANPETLPKLKEAERKDVAELAQSILRALDTEPEILPCQN